MTKNLKKEPLNDNKESEITEKTTEEATNKTEEAPASKPKPVTHFIVSVEGLNNISSAIEELLQTKVHTKKAIYSVINENLKAVK
jgi:hypothetical protein